MREDDMHCTVTRSVRTRIFSAHETSEIVSAVLRAIGGRTASITVHVVGDTAMRTLNRTYRGQDRPTDVLAFSAREGMTVGIPPSSGESDDWGDMYLCAPHIVRQAHRFKVSSREEYIRMLAHGVLHLGGYDHIRARDAKKMFAIQERFVKELTHRMTHKE